MSIDNQSIIRYRIVSQNRDNVLIIEDINEGVHICCQANDIIGDETFINGFSKNDNEIISFIADRSTMFINDET